MNDITESRGSTQFIYREDTNEIYMQLKEADGKCLIYESTNFDCENNKKNETIQSEELRILYVALTRSKKFFTLWWMKKDLKKIILLKKLLGTLSNVRWRKII